MATLVGPDAFSEDLRVATASEQALIGCCLFDPERFREVAHIRPDHFFEPANELIWKTIRELISQGNLPDLATLTDRLAGNGLIAELGGPGYLFNLVDKCGAPRLARQHAQCIQHAHARRTGVTKLNEGARALISTAGRSAPAIIAGLRGDLQRLEQGACDEDGALIAADAAADALLDALDYEAENGIERGCMTGLKCIDRRLRGLRPGWLITIGGRPSMGKSGLIRCTAYGGAGLNPDKLFLIFSLEMDAREVSERAMSAASFAAGKVGEGIPYNEFAGGMDVRDRYRLRDLQRLLPGNVLIDDRSAVGVDEIHRRVWAAKAQGPVGAVFIDYLQLLSRPSIPGRSEALLLGDVTRALKTLAREAETCVVLASQLNRSVESRDDKRPQLSDLRDSGSIEQDSNVVLFPYREAYYLERAEPLDANSTEHAKWQTKLELVRRRMDVIAAKVRGGATGTDRQVYYAEFDHVADLPA